MVFGNSAQLPSLRETFQQPSFVDPAPLYLSRPLPFVEEGADTYYLRVRLEAQTAPVAEGVALPRVCPQRRGDILPGKTELPFPLEVTRQTRLCRV